MISNLHYRHLQFKPENTGCVDIHDSLTFSFSMASTGTHYWNHIQYQTSSGSWSDWDGVTAISAWQGPDGRYHVKLRGIGNTKLTCGTGATQKNQFKCSSSSSGDLRISGNIENLLDYSTVAAGNHCVVNEWGLKSAFESWGNLKYVDPWFLPLPSIPNYACDSMFRGCSKLVIGPEIPATSVGINSCSYMFENCYRLKKAMTFCNAVSVGKSAFFYLHNTGTTGGDLEVAPAILPATTLAEKCYEGMYMGCNKLKHCPKLPATTLTKQCYSFMFKDCTSLEGLPELPATTLMEECYQSMFSGCSSLAVTPGLPATTLAKNCYRYMFQSCTSLTTAPALPATTLVDGCYNAMFNGCTSLTTAPSLPATTPAASCYYSMFSGCTSLTAAPALPATTLADSCYYSMFNGCTSLTAVPKLSATTLADSCYRLMFRNCTSLTTIPELPATTLAANCYYSMFQDCTSIKMSQSQTGEYQTPYRIPKSGTGTGATNAFRYMFIRTGGTFTGDPTINTTYYTSNSIR